MSGVAKESQWDLVREIASNPDDDSLLGKLEALATEAQDFEALRQAYEKVVERRGGPAAEALASRLSKIFLAAGEQTRRPRDGMEFYLRAAHVLMDFHGEADEAAKALAAAWRLAPDHRVVERTWSLLDQPSAKEMPDYLLVARSQLGGDGALKATVQLAARRLEEGRLGESEQLYLQLKKIRPNDHLLDEALSQIAQLKKGRNTKVKSAESAVKRAGKTGAAAVKAWTSFGISLIEIGETVEGEEALRTACAAGDGPDAEARLERLLRDQGRLEELGRFLRLQMERAATDKKQARQSRLVELRRRLYRLLKDELRRPDEAKNVMNYTRAVGETDAAATIKEARRIGRKGNWQRACKMLETAVDVASSGDARLAMMLEIARVHDLELKDETGAEEIYQSVKATNPDSIEMLQFFRRVFRQRREKKRAYNNLTHLHDVLIGANHRKERVSVAVEMARLARNSLSDKEYAVEAWKRVLKDEPNHKEAHRELRRLYEDGERWHSEIELLNQKVELLEGGKVEEQIKTLFEIIELYQHPDKLGMEDMVVATYRRVVELSPSNQKALESLARKYRDSGKWTELIGVLRQRIEHAEDPEELVSLFGEIAALYLEQIESDAQAIPILERLLELDPGNLGITQRLRDAFSRKHNTWRLYETYQKELELLEGSERAQVLVELARIAAEELFRFHEAIAWWKKLLEVSPGDQRAIAALEQLHAEQEDWPGYVALLEKKLEGAYTRKQRVELLLELGEVAYSRLGDEEKARRIFLRICDLSPFNTRARRYLQRIYITRRAWPKLLELYAPREDWEGYLRLLDEFSDDLEDRDLIADIQVERARIQEEVVDDLASAVQSLERALAASAGRLDVARRLLQQYTAESPVERQIAAHTAVATLSQDQGETEASWRTLAKLRTDDAGVFEAWSKALLAGGPSGSIVGIDDFEQSMQTTGDWEEGAETLSTVLSKLPKAAVAARLRLHRSIGQVARERLKDPDRAITHYKCVLFEEPGDVDALGALEELYLSQHNFIGLEEVLRARSDVSEDPGSKQQAMGRLGQLYEDVFGNLERAGDVYRQMVRNDPNDEQSLAKLRRTYTALESWQELAEALEQVLAATPGHATIIELRLELATLYRTRLEELRAAVEHYRAALEVPGVDQHVVIAGLEDLRAYPSVEEAIIPILERAYRTSDQPEALLALLKRKVDLATDPQDQLPIYDEIAFLAQHAAGDLETAFEAQQARFRLVPAHRATWNELEQLAEQLGAWDILAPLWRDALSGGGVSEPRPFKPLDKRADRNALRLALARVLGENEGDVEERIELYEAVIRESKDASEHPDLYDRLEELYRHRGDLASVADVLVRASKIAIGVAVRRGKLLQAAEINAEHLGDTDKAVDIYKELLTELEWDQAVAHLLANVYEVTKRHAELAALMEEAASHAESPEERDALRLRLADTQVDKLKNRAEAISVLVELLPSQWVSEEAVKRLIDLASSKAVKATERNRVIEELTRHFDSTGDNGRKADVHLLRLGSSRSAKKRSQLYVEAGLLLTDGWPEETPPSLELANRAYDLFVEGLEEDISNDDASRSLRRAARWTRKFENCANHLARAAETASENRVKARRWLDLADLAARDLDDPALAIEAWNRVIALDRVDGDVIDRAFDGLMDAYAALGADENRLRVLRLKRERSDVALQRFELWVQEAAILHALEAPEEVLNALDRALELANGADEEAWNVARDAFAEEAAGIASEPTHGHEGLRLLRAIANIEAPNALNHALRRLHQGAALAENRLERPDVSIALLTEARRHAPTDENTVTNLERLFETHGLYRDKVNLLEDVAQLALDSGDDEKAVALLVEVGEILRSKLSDPAAALESFGKVLQERPDYYPALDAVRDCINNDEQAATGRFMLANAYKRSGDDTGRIEILEEILESDDLKVDEAVSQVYLDLANTRLSRGEDAASVWRYAEAAYRTNPVSEAGLERRTLLIDLSSKLSNAEALAPILLEAGSQMLHTEQRLARRRMDVAFLTETELDAKALVPFWKAILDDEPTDKKVLSFLEGHARETGNADELIAVLRAKAAAAVNLGEKIHRLRELADLYVDTDREDEAIGTFERILQDDPGQIEVFDKLTERYQAKHMPEDLVEVLEAQILHTRNRTRKRDLQKWLARTWWVDLDDLDRAVSVYSELLGGRAKDVEPEVVEALESIWDVGSASESVFDLLEPIYLASKSHRALASLYRTAASREGDTGFRSVCLEKLHQVQVSELGEEEAAFETLLRLIEIDDYNPERLDLAETMADKLDSWATLLTFYGRLVEEGWGNVDFVTRVGGLWDEKLGDVSQAIHSYERALEQDSLHALTRDRLTDLLSRQERWEDLVEHLGRTAEAHLDRGDKVRAWWERAELLLTRLDDVERALASLDRILQLDPSHQEANERKAELLRQVQRPEDLHQHYRQWTDRLPTSELSRQIKTRLALSLLDDQHTMVEGLTELSDVLEQDADLPEAHEALVAIIERAERTESNLGRMPEAWGHALDRAVELLEKVTGEDPTATQQEAIWRVQLRKLKGDKKRKKLLGKLGDLLIEQGKADAALVCYGEIARANPGERKLRKILIKLGEMGADPAGLVSLYEECLQAELSDAQRSALGHDLAAHLLKRTDRVEDACDCYERLVEQDPSDKKALEALASTYRQIGVHGSEERILSRLVDLAKNRKESVQFSMRLGDVRLDHLGRTKDALLAFEDCLPEGLTDAAFRTKVERLYAQRQDFQALAELYENTLQQRIGSETRLETLAKSAQVFETQLDDLDAAAERCRELLGLQPNHRFALRSLARIERRRENWAELSDVLLKLEKYAAGTPERARFMASRATLAARFLGRSEQALRILEELDEIAPELCRDAAAVATLRAALEDSQTRVEAAHRLEPLLVAAGDWEGLLEALNVILETRSDANHEIKAAVRMAQVAEGKLQTPLRALQIAGDVLVQHVGDELASMLVQYLDGVADRHGCWDALSALVERVVSAASGGEKERESLEWLASVQTRGNAEPSLIASTMEQLLQLDQNNEEWLGRLEDLYRQAGRWDSLRELISRRLGQVEGEERVALLLQMAQAYEDEGDMSAAVTMMAEVLQDAPRQPEALRALETALKSEQTAGQAAASLERIAREDGDWARVIALLETQSDALVDPRPRGTIFVEMATLYEDRLQNVSRAFECLGRALDYDDEKLEILSRMEVLAGERDLYRELADTLEQVGRGTENRDLRVELLLRLAEVRETQLEDEEGARQAIRQVQQLAPDHPHALRSMVRLARGTDDLDELESCTRGLIDVATDQEERVALLGELYEIARRRGDPGAMISACEDGLRERPGETVAVGRLIELYREHGEAGEIEDLLNREIPSANDPRERGKLSCWLGEHYEEKGEQDRALASFEESWSLDSNSLHTATALVRRYAELEHWRRLHGVLRRQIELFETEEEAMESLLHLGRISKEHLDDVSESVEAFERVLEVDPTNVTALDALVDLYFKQRRYRRFIEVCRTRATHEEDSEPRNALLMRAARAALAEPDLEASTNELIELVLQDDPYHPQACVLEVRRSLGRGDDAHGLALKLEKSLPSAVGDDRINVLLTLSEIYSQHLDDAHGALPFVMEARELDPRHPELAALLRGVFEKTGSFRDLCHILETEFEHATSAVEQCERAIELARMYWRELGDDEAFKEWITKAREIRRDSVEAAEMLVEFHMERDQIPQLLPALEWLVNYYDAKKITRDLPVLSHKLGRLLEQSGEDEKALDYYRMSLQADGTYIPNLLDYGRLLTKRERWVGSLRVHQSLLMQRHKLESEEDREAVLYNLAVASLEMSEKTRARQYLARLLEENPDHQDAKKLQSRIRP